MTLRVTIHSIAVLLLLFAAVATAQDQPWRSTAQPTGQGQQATPAGQAQPSNIPPYGQPTYGQGNPQANPGNPQANQGNPQAMPPMGVAPRIPSWWPLPAVDQQRVDAVLRAWELSGDRIQMFTSKFAKRVYKPALNGPNVGQLELVSTDVGEMKYKKPDKGLFEITGDPSKTVFENEGRREKWIYDGKSYYQYDYAQKKVIQQDLSPDVQGKALSEGPVPFLFGARADSMKQQYWIRQVPSPPTANQIWLEIWPRQQANVADFARAEVRLDARDMRPVGVQLYKSLGRQVRTRDGQLYTLQNSPVESYTFYETEINPNNLVLFFKGDPFTPRMDRDWTKDIKPAQNGPRMGQNPPADQNRMGQNPPPQQIR